MTRHLWFALGTAGALATPAAAQSVHYEGGASVASGTYIFTERTTSWTLSNGLALSAGPLTLRGTFPLYIQNTNLLVGTTTGLVPTGGSHSGAVADSSAARGGQSKGRGSNMQVTRSDVLFAAMADAGSVEVPSSVVTGFEPMFGDPMFSLSYSGGGRTGITVSAGLKVPATDTTNFGTGAWDIGGTIGLSRFFGGSSVFSVDVSYWHLGDPPGLDLTDPIMASVGVAYLTTGGWGGSLSMSGARSVIEGFDNSYSLTGAITRVWARSAIGVNASAGFSETAPDFILGVNWRVALTRG